MGRTDLPELELLVLPTDVDTETLVLHLGWVLFVEIGHFLCVLRIFHLNETLRNKAPLGFTYAYDKEKPDKDKAGSIPDRGSGCPSRKHRGGGTLNYGTLNTTQ